ncbi:Nucleoporin nup84 [Cryptotrichosporon argae]
MAAPSTYATFAKVLSSYHGQYAEAGPSSQLDAPIRRDAVLDEQGGLLTALMGSLEETLRQDDETLTPDEREALLLEHRTWGLVRSIYENRLERSAADFVATSAADQLRENPYTTPEDLTQTMVNEDSELSLFAALIDHLQTRALFSAPPPIEARHGYLPSTVRRLRTAKLNPSSASTAVPPSLDPDFALRDPHTYALAGEDATYHAPLMDVLWDLVRHGELDQAIAVCEEGGEPWRAASLMGGRRWSMAGLTKDELALGTMEGNRTRQLWKKSCRAIAKNATLSPSERHLYAALTSDLPTLLPACETWEDHVWAHVQARLEGRIERRWRDLGGFWEAEGRREAEGGDVEPDQGGLEHVFAAVADSQKDAVVRASHNPYHVAQKMIVLDRSDALLDSFADRLAGLEDSVSLELIGPLLRFFTHLVLVRRALSLSVPAAAANAIIEAYLRVLERGGEAGLVAMYAACLREGSGEESYARFLRSMKPNATKEERRDALLRAKQHHLDVATIAKETVRMILQEAFATIPALTPGVPDISSFATGLSERDVYLIRSIEWLTFVPETADEALVKSNDVARYFLALGQAGAVLALLKTLPDFPPPDDDDDADRALNYEEHVHIVKLFSVFAAHDGVDDVLARAPKATATKVEQFNWKKKLASALDVLHTETIDVLTSDWLRFPIRSKSENGSQRKKELSRIRQIFVPDLVLRLHARLMDNRVHFATLLQQAIDLSKLVAAEDNHVYEEFFSRATGPDRLAAYLDKAREASMAALEAGSRDPFRAPVAVAV